MSTLRPPSSLTLFTFATGLSLTACYGGAGSDPSDLVFGSTGDAVSDGSDTASDTASDSAGSDSGDDSTPTASTLCDSHNSHDVAGPRLLRRLTADEYEASVRFALNLDEDLWSGPSLPPDPAAKTGFNNDADRLRVSQAYALALEQSAQQVAGVFSHGDHLLTQLPCAAQGGLDCAQQFLNTQARRLFRRSLLDHERDRYLALFDEIDQQGGWFEDWARWAVQTMLQSPHFIYRSELGDPNPSNKDEYDLQGHEVATLLAFAFTGAPPDDALLERAEAGELDTAEAIASTASALAFTPEGTLRPALAQRLREFHHQWLGMSTLANLQKDPLLYPGFDDQVKASMLAEFDAYIDDVVFEQRGDMAELLTTEQTQLDQTLIDYYGYGTEAGLTSKPPGWGTGLLSLGGVLATHATYLATSPTQRGKLIRARLLCSELPPPPPDIGNLPEPEATQTTRQRYEEHAINPSCSGCHALMDPIGFGFEGLDAAGRYRETEQGIALDLTGVVQGLDGQNASFDGPAELAEALAAAEHPARCMATQMATFALGLSPHVTECIVDDAAESLAQSQLGIAEAYVAFAQASHFRKRQNL